MVNPIYQQGEELLLNQFGSKYLGVAAHTNVNSNEFIIQEDAVISVLTGGDSSIAANNVDYKASMSLSGVTLKQGALIVAPQGESFQSITIDSGTIMTYNSVVGGTKPSAVPLLLDLYPDAAAAYSLRKLRTDYTGPAIKVRKTVAGDTSTQDIGFVNGELDTASLLSFADGGDVYVQIWYDQSGNGNDLAQVSASAQPKIVASGVVNTKNSEPCVDFDGISQEFITTELLDTSADNSLISVFSIDGGVDNNVLNFSDGTNVFAIGTAIASSTNLCLRAPLSADNKSITYATGSQVLTFAQSIPSNNIFANNIPEDGTDLCRQSLLSNSIGSRGGAFYLDGQIQEIVIYNSDQSSNRAAIENNINTHYTIY